MSEVITTFRELRDDIVAKRGGIERFDGVQQRILDALVSELAKKPHEIDVEVVQNLMSLLPRPVAPPPEKAWIPEIVFVDSFDLKLRGLLSECQPHLASDMTINALGAHVSELEAENEGLRASLAQLQGDLEQLRSAEVKEAIRSAAGHWDASQPDGRVRGLGDGNGGHGNNVVRMPIHNSAHSLTVQHDLIGRYPNLKFDEPVW